MFFFHILNQLRVLHSLPGLGWLLWGYENWTMTGLVLFSLALVVWLQQRRQAVAWRMLIVPGLALVLARLLPLGRIFDCWGMRPMSGIRQAGCC